MLAAGHRRFSSVFAGPFVWLAHFLASYVTVAVWCGRFTPDGLLGSVRWGLAVLTLIAVAGELIIAWRGFKAYRYGVVIDTVDHETVSEERRRLLAFVTWVLAGMSLTATVYVALPLWLLPRCG